MIFYVFRLLGQTIVTCDVFIISKLLNLEGDCTNLYRLSDFKAHFKFQVFLTEQRHIDAFQQIGLCQALAEMPWLKV